MEMSVSQFKAKCLGVVEQVARQKKPVVITRYGRAAVEVVPYTGGTGGALFGRSAKRTKIMGDITGTGESWDAET